MVIAVSLVVGLIWPASALAAQRYASPTGSGTVCSAAQPCPLREAIEGAGFGDEVIVKSGTYPTETTQIHGTGVDIHGEAGAPPPLISSTGDRVLLVDDGSVRDLRLGHSVGTFAALLSFGGTVDRVQARSEDGQGCAPFGTVVTNSVCSSGISAGVAVDAGGSYTSTLRNVTAESDSGPAIRVNSGGSAIVTLNAVNTIALALGSDSDVVTWVQSTGDSTANLSYSNFDTTDNSLGGAITAPGSGTNQTAAPLLADVAGGDFHQLAGSPTINHGITDALNGALDFDRQARAIGASTDIGADEYFPPKLSIRVKPRRQAVKVRRVAKFRVRVTNTGGSAANRVRVCIKKAPKVLRGKRCRSIGTLAGGASAKRVFRLRPKRAAAHRRFKLRFRATANGVRARTAIARLKVKP